MSMCTQDPLPQDSGPGPQHGSDKLAAIRSVVPFLQSRWRNVGSASKSDV